MKLKCEDGAKIGRYEVTELIASRNGAVVLRARCADADDVVLRLYHATRGAAPLLERDERAVRACDMACLQVHEVGDLGSEQTMEVRGVDVQIAPRFLVLRHQGLTPVQLAYPPQRWRQVLQAKDGVGHSLYVVAGSNAPFVEVQEMSARKVWRMVDVVHLLLNITDEEMHAIATLRNAQDVSMILE